MKKLNKLEINPKNLIKNEELLNLRGGYGGDGFTCMIGTKASFGEPGASFQLDCSDCVWRYIKNITGEDHCWGKP
jgi:hypothetical protein